MPLLLAVALVAGAAVPVPPPAPAMDQAYVVPLPVAKAAVALLGRHDAVWSFCEPCGEMAPTWTPFETVSAEPWEGGAGMWVVTLDGEGVDLAYTYVRVGASGQAANVALLTAMDGVDGVSAVIEPGN